MEILFLRIAVIAAGIAAIDTYVILALIWSKNSRAF